MSYQKWYSARVILKNELRHDFPWLLASSHSSLLKSKIKAIILLLDRLEITSRSNGSFRCPDSKCNDLVQLIVDNLHATMKCIMREMRAGSWYPNRRWLSSVTLTRCHLSEGITAEFEIQLERYFLMLEACHNAYSL
jgi:hypothetical protein